MSCASAGYTSRQAIEAIVGRLTGRKIPHTKLEYVGNHISLGRRDGILRMVDDEARAKPKYTGGRKAARIKSGIPSASPPSAGPASHPPPRDGDSPAARPPSTTRSSTALPPLSSWSAVRRLPAGAAELDRREVTRRAVRPLTIDLAVVRASAEGWYGGLRQAGRFAPFFRRALLLDSAPPAAEEKLMEAAFYGIGVLVADGESVDLLLEPRLYTPRRPTPAAWCFTEELHHRIG
jgi:hypothetical protein